MIRQILGKKQIIHVLSIIGFAWLIGVCLQKTGGIEDAMSTVKKDLG